MMGLRSNRRRAARRAAWPLAAIMAIGLGIGGAGIGAPSAHATEAEDDAFDTRMIRGFLRSLGLRDGTEPGIDYRERSPLVVPPSRDLPPPESTPVTAQNPAWPVDVDVKRTQERRAARRTPRKTVEEESLPELPQELDRVGRAQGTPPGQEPRTSSDRRPQDPSTPSELGAKGLFSRGLFGGQREEYATFAGEPERRRLIEPPAGYRTPSAAQPYGVGKERWTPQAINPMDTPAMRGTQ